MDLNNIQYSNYSRYLLGIGLQLESWCVSSLEIIYLLSVLCLIVTGYIL